MERIVDQSLGKRQLLVQRPRAEDAAVGLVELAIGDGAYPTNEELEAIITQVQLERGGFIQRKHVLERIPALMRNNSNEEMGD